jgi:bifunctional UDP-N-acetylglucosamine pyrophosphorylase / glucosamine-1-phosphate N-acetyltransferase
MSDLRVLILAAGKGTRMKSRKAKVLHQVGGASLVEHVLATARSVSSSVSVVIGHQAETLRALMPDVSFVEQKEQLGTGHAVMAAREQLSAHKGDLLILPGDVPLISSETLKAFVAFHTKGGYAASVMTANVDEPQGYGRIVRRGDNELKSIVEHRDATPEVLKISEINSSIYVFNTPALFAALTKVRNENSQSEYYLTDVIGILSAQGARVGAFKSDSADEILGINTRKELAAIDRIMRRRKCESLMAEGVTIVDPDSTFIDGAVQIGADTVIYPSVQIHGKTIIAEDVTIHSFTRIANSRIGARSTVLNGCVVTDTTLGEDVSVGPFAHLRPNTKLEDGVKVGNFVEIKKSTLGPGTKSMHLAYLGDATIGKKCNIGAGTITCNYDGYHKHPTVIEDGVFIGSDSQLIAPVRVGKDAYVGAGSSITEDVPPESLAIARGRQVVKEGWVRDRKKNK